MIEHEIHLPLASGAQLTILYFSDREQRWIFSYHYVGERTDHFEIVNKTTLVAEYADGRLAPKLVLSMHVIVPGRLGVEFFAGMDISPGAKTYVEFTYERIERIESTPGVYRLVEICKGANHRVRLDDTEPALVRPIGFPFPVYDRVPVKDGHVHLPFLRNDDTLRHFTLPMSTVR
jgi:hypothetical protein